MSWRIVVLMSLAGGCICLATETGGPLMLTDLIDRKGIEMARDAARNNLAGVEGYSGLLTVGKNKGSHLFFWYFPAARTVEVVAPLLIWVNGWNSSSLYGVFLEIGPFRVNVNKLETSDYPWTSLAHLLFMDSVPGIGFSFLSEGKFSTSTFDISENMYTALVQFLKLFPELVTRRLYVCGSSYGSKYGTALAYRIDQGNELNLAGMMYSSAIFDPIHQSSFGELLYNVGILGSDDRDIFEAEERDVKELVHKGNFTKARLVMSNVTNGLDFFLSKLTGTPNGFNFLETNTPRNEWQDFVQRPELREILHVGSTTFSYGEIASNYLIEDMMLSAAPFLEELLNRGYKVLFYSGQLDIVGCYPVRERLIDMLSWGGAEGFRRTKRLVWRRDTGDVEGYIKMYDNLIEAMVTNAGHIISSDQPRKAWNLAACFLRNCSITQSGRNMHLFA